MHATQSKTMYEAIQHVRHDIESFSRLLLFSPAARRPAIEILASLLRPDTIGKFPFVFSFFLLVNFVWIQQVGTWLFINQKYVFFTFSNSPPHTHTQEPTPDYAPDGILTKSFLRAPAFSTFSSNNCVCCGGNNNFSCFFGEDSSRSIRLSRMCCVMPTRASAYWWMNLARGFN